MGMPPTTERIASLNPEINPEKYKHSGQIGDLNLGGQVPPQGTQPAELCLVHVLMSSLVCPNQGQSKLHAVLLEWTL
jgi:hypothetical protein